MRSLDQTIWSLAQDLRPVRSRSATARLLTGGGGGLAISVFLVGLCLGYRPDMAEGGLPAIFWVKLAYALGLGLLGLGVVERLSRPAAPAAGRALWMLAPLLGMAGLAAVQFIDAPATGRAHMVMGASANVCAWRILLFAAPPLAGLVWAVRGLAPTRLTVAGGAVGLAGGGLGAAAYALHCEESAAPFVAVWYTLGIVLCAALGAGLGSRTLRW
jgi:hypothetical protein